LKWQRWSIPHLLNNVAPVDVLPDGSTAVLTGPVTDTGIAGALDVGEAWTYTTSYAASQADVDAGVALVNTVSVTSNETGTDSIDADAETVVNSEPDFVLSKVVDQATINVPGTLNYTIELENTGNVSLSGIVINDTLPDGSAGTLTGPATDTGVSNVVDVGETWVYTISHATSTETGTTARDASAETVISQSAGFTLAKTVDIPTTSTPATLSYVIELANTGNVTLTNVVVNDTLPDGTAGSLIGPTGDAGTALALDVGGR